MREHAPASPAAVAIAYALVCVVWGSTYLFIKLGVEVLPPYLLGGVRFSIAGVVLVAACLATGRALPLEPRTIGRIILVAVLLLVVGNGLLNLSEQHLSSGLAALLVVTTPLWMTLLAMAGAGSERLSPLGWLGLLVGLAGVGILVKPFDGGVESSWIGVVAVTAAAFSWAVGTVYARRRLRGVDPFAASAVETAIAGPLMLVVHLLIERGQPVVWNDQAWLAVGYLAGMGSLVGFTAFVFITHHLPSSKAGTYAYVNPVVAVLLGWWLLDEMVTWRLTIGGGTILAGLLLLYFARVREGGDGPYLRGSAPAAPEQAVLMGKGD
ncbi:MAG TPA: EamA family transporter [Gemmatimonadota bacterium]|nr:EamA family transporter [Gemmatimonadota bacterium]